MRRVRCFRWEVQDFKDTDSSGKTRSVKRSARVLVGEGWFHQWGQFGDLQGQETMAVVEFDDGRTEAFGTGLVEFVKGPSEDMTLRENIQALIRFLQDGLNKKA